MTDELKPCPFCGTIARAKAILSGESAWEIYCNNIQCPRYEFHVTEKDAIAAWNTRHESDTLPEWLGIILHNKLLEQTHTPVNSYSSGFYTALSWVLSLRKPEDK